MSEPHFFADVNLPLHVWVRERTGRRGFRWVLKSAAEVRAGDAPPADRPPPVRDAGPQLPAR